MQPAGTGTPIAQEILNKLDAIKQTMEANPNASAAELREIRAKLQQLLDRPTGVPDGDDVLKRLEEIKILLTLQGQSSDTAEQLAAVTARLEKLAQAIFAANVVIARIDAILGQPIPVALNLTVQSAQNLPASYVDTSTIWAVQRRTGISHAVLVINSNDPEWVRLEPEYQKAHDKLPSMQILDVVSKQIVIDRTPQLVIYYNDGREADVIVGDRAVVTKFREIYHP